MLDLAWIENADITAQMCWLTSQRPLTPREIVQGLWTVFQRRVPITQVCRRLHDAPANWFVAKDGDSIAFPEDSDFYSDFLDLTFEAGPLAIKRITPKEETIGDVAAPRTINKMEGRLTLSKWVPVRPGALDFAAVPSRGL